MLDDAVEVTRTSILQGAGSGIKKRVSADLLRSASAVNAAAVPTAPASPTGRRPSVYSGTLQGPNLRAAAQKAAQMPRGGSYRMSAPGGNGGPMCTSPMSPSCRVLSPADRIDPFCSFPGVPGAPTAGQGTYPTGGGAGSSTPGGFLSRTGSVPANRTLNSNQMSLPPRSPAPSSFRNFGAVPSGAGAGAGPYRPSAQDLPAGAVPTSAQLARTRSEPVGCLAARLSGPELFSHLAPPTPTAHHSFAPAADAILESDSEDSEAGYEAQSQGSGLDFTIPALPNLALESEDVGLGTVEDADREEIEAAGLSTLNLGKSALGSFGSGGGDRRSRNSGVGLGLGLGGPLGSPRGRGQASFRSGELGGFGGLGLGSPTALHRPAAVPTPVLWSGVVRASEGGAEPRGESEAKANRIDLHIDVDSSADVRVELESDAELGPGQQLGRGEVTPPPMRRAQSPGVSSVGSELESEHTLQDELDHLIEHHLGFTQPSEPSDLSGPSLPRRGSGTGAAGLAGHHNESEPHPTTLSRASAAASGPTSPIIKSPRGEDRRPEPPTPSSTALESVHGGGAGGAPSSMNELGGFSASGSSKEDLRLINAVENLFRSLSLRREEDEGVACRRYAPLSVRSGPEEVELVADLSHLGEDLCGQLEFSVVCRKLCVALGGQEERCILLPEDLVPGSVQVEWIGGRCGEFLKLTAARRPVEDRADDREPGTCTSSGSEPGPGTARGPGEEDDFAADESDF